MKAKIGMSAGPNKHDLALAVSMILLASALSLENEKQSMTFSLLSLRSTSLAKVTRIFKVGILSEEKLKDLRMAAIPSQSRVKIKLETILMAVVLSEENENSARRVTVWSEVNPRVLLPAKARRTFNLSDEKP